MAGEYSGKDLYIKFGGTALSADFRTFSTSETAKEIDATAGADARMVYLTGPVDGEATGTFLDINGTAGTTNWVGALTPGNSGTLQWYPSGTAAGSVVYSQDAKVTSRKRDYPYDDVVSYDVGWRLSGAQTAGTA